jgi:hypothetical protein
MIAHRAETMEKAYEQASASQKTLGTRLSYQTFQEASGHRLPSVILCVDQFSHDTVM